MSQYPEIYNSTRWKALRRNQLAKEPLCRYCSKHGDIVAADTVDHIEPHRGVSAIAFNPENLQSLCKPCHDTHADAKDRGKTMAGCDESGYPIDPNHEWSK